MNRNDELGVIPGSRRGMPEPAGKMAADDQDSPAVHSVPRTQVELHWFRDLRQPRFSGTEVVILASSIYEPRRRNASHHGQKPRYIRLSTDRPTTRFASRDHPGVIFSPLGAGFQVERPSGRTAVHMDHKCHNGASCCIVKSTRWVRLGHCWRGGRMVTEVIKERANTFCPLFRSYYWDPVGF